MEEKAKGIGSLGPDLKTVARIRRPRAAAGDGFLVLCVRVRGKRLGEKRNCQEAGPPDPSKAQKTRPGGRTARSAVVPLARSTAVEPPDHQYNRQEQNHSDFFGGARGTCARN